MKLIYSPRALADLHAIAAYYVENANPTVAESVEQRFRDVIDRICRAPEAAPRVSQRSEVRVVSVVRYPYQIFYRMRGNEIDILYMRHTSRRPLKDVD